MATSNDAAPAPILVPATANQRRIAQMSEQELRAYNAEKSRQSYERRKQNIAKQRILKRLINNGNRSVRECEQLLYDQSRGWNEEEKEMIKEVLRSTKKKMVVNPVSEEEIHGINENISYLSKGFYQLKNTDTTSDAYLKTLHNTSNLFLSIQECERALIHLNNTGHLMKHSTVKDETQRQLNLNVYISRLHTIYQIYGRKNVLDLFKHPEDLHNKLITSHLRMNSIKDYVSVLLVLYKRAKDIPNDVSSILHNINHLVDYDQVNKLRLFLKNGIALSKENETFKQYTESFYAWEDIKLLPKLAHMTPGSSLEKFRELIILTIYTNENVLRDDLGSIRIIYNEDQYDSSKLENVYKVMEGKLLFKVFKTNYVFTRDDQPFEIHLSRATRDIIENYIQAYEQKFGSKPVHLITKKNGDTYTHGKLSGYITTIFEKYTGVKNMTINDLRHSFATFHRYQLQNVKRKVATMMHHSFDQHLRYERHSDVVKRFPLINEETRLQFTDPQFPLLGESCLFYRVPNDETSLDTGVIEKNEDPGSMNLYPYRIQPKDNKLQPINAHATHDEKGKTFYVL
jgi:hypothetical protein